MSSSGPTNSTSSTTAQVDAPPPNRLEEAVEFLSQYDEETKRVPRGRIHDVIRSIRETGTYEMTYDELVMAGKLAWRNSNRCNGRRFWRGLAVNDCRDATTEAEIFEGCVQHLRQATNNGKLRPMLTVFAQRQDNQPGIRIWNSQLVRYAGYVQADGKVIGDPVNAELTKNALKLGWQGAGTRFDVLPLIIQLPDREPRMFDIPDDAVDRVRITHPDLAWFEDLGLEWHSLPAITDMVLDAGGLTYTAAPFSGWYMDTEIGSRNFGDVDRYNMMPIIADKLGLDTKHDRSLWKDRVLLELNRAVIYSYRKAGVTLVDHHTASVEFMRFAAQEEQLGRVPHADWSWVVPPMSGAACPVFHRDFDNQIVKPNFYYREPV